MHQKEFYDLLEAADATVIFATTHKNSIKDALVNRFGANLYEMRRPTTAETISHIRTVCTSLGVTAPDDQLARVADHYGYDLKPAWISPTWLPIKSPDEIVTAEFVDAVLGIDADATTVPAPVSKRSVKL